MSSARFLKNKVLYSTLGSESALKPQRGRGKRNTTATLMLTSLVDAFSILVIFLMMNSATEQSDFETGKNVTLPKAAEVQTTFKTATVKISGSQFMVNNVPATNDTLFVTLQKLHEQLKASATPQTADSLVVIADKDLDYASLNPLIVMGSRAGFTEFKFAVEKSGTNEVKTVQR